MKILRRLLFLMLIGFSGLVGLVGCVQRRLLYFPGHDDATALAARHGLEPWSIDGEFTGYARLRATPRKIWFVLHGNGGQAGQRGYISDRLNPADSVFILEYPGYGHRPGKPSREAFDAAALRAYNSIVQQFGAERVVVLGESLGSGPACMLARAPVPPQQLVLVVPFDVLTDVAQEKFTWLPVGLIMLDRWDNVAALRGYKGRVDIFGATRDQVIPVHHARALAASLPGAVYHEVDGDHGWAATDAVDLSQL